METLGVWSHLLEALIAKEKNLSFLAETASRCKD